MRVDGVIRTCLAVLKPNVSGWGYSYLFGCFEAQCEWMGLFVPVWLFWSPMWVDGDIHTCLAVLKPNVSGWGYSYILAVLKPNASGWGYSYLFGSFKAQCEWMGLFLHFGCFEAQCEWMGLFLPVWLFWSPMRVDGVIRTCLAVLKPNAFAMSIVWTGSSQSCSSCRTLSSVSRLFSSFCAC